MTLRLVARRVSRYRLLVALAASACASDGAAERAPRTGADRAPEAAVARGKASYYADALAGHATASGEAYDPGALTAAHRTLPFGTRVEVRRKDGRAVVVRINDRGPFGGKGRVIDLSRRAAEELGMIREGVIEVELFVLPAGGPRD